MRKESEGDKCDFILGRDQKNSHIHMLGRRVNGLIRVAANATLLSSAFLFLRHVPEHGSLKAEFCRHYLATHKGAACFDFPI